LKTDPPAHTRRAGGMQILDPSNRVSVGTWGLRRFDGNAQHTGHLRVCVAVFDILNITDHAVFVYTSIRRFLSGPLIWADCRLLIYLGSGVPEGEPRGDIAADGLPLLNSAMPDSAGAYHQSLDCPNIEVMVNLEPEAAWMLHS
jgi:hypothetical protein